MFVTFSGQSKIEVLTGDLASKYEQLEHAHWDMNTNLHAAFAEILRVAVTNQVPAEDMPSYILILSDMEFDVCAKYDDSAMQMIRRKYEEAGYEVPGIIFWNLNARQGNVPVKYNEMGAALVSGFSPSIMTSVLKADEINPVSIMLQTLNSERYERIV